MLLNPLKYYVDVVNTFSSGLDRMFCCMLRLEAFVLLLTAQRSGKQDRELRLSHLLQSRAVMMNLGTHAGYDLISSAETG